MKVFYIFFFLVLLQNCSFDKKSGIWKEVDQVANNKENKILEGFIDLNMQVSVPGERKQEFGYWAIELHLIV